MHINALLLCNEAEIRDDRLHVTDGGWDGLTALAWPAGQEIQVVTLLAPTVTDVGRELSAVVTVMAPDGSECGRTEATLVVERMRRQVPVVLPVFGEFHGTGEYRLSVTVANAKAQTSFALDGPALDVRVEDLPQG